MVPLIIGGAIAAGSIASNLYNSYENRKAAEDAYDDIVDRAEEVSLANDADIANVRNRLQNAYGAGAGKYQQALQDFLDSDVYQNKDFEFTGNINDYMDPFQQQRVQAAMTAINNSAATGGNRFSSDYVNRVAGKQQALANEAWKDAYDRLMRERSVQLQEWQANAQNGWNNYNATQDRAKYAVDTYGRDRDALLQGYNDTTMAQMNNRLGLLNTQANVAAGRANAMQNQNAGGALAAALGPVAQFAGAYFGAGS